MGRAWYGELFYIINVIIFGSIRIEHFNPLFKNVSFILIR